MDIFLILMKPSNDVKRKISLISKDRILFLLGHIIKCKGHQKMRTTIAMYIACTTASTAQYQRDCIEIQSIYKLRINPSNLIKTKKLY
jgi:carboxypeptidase C (cathepsin A)